MELAEDLSVQAFMHVFHRFVARRTYPNVMISDNGTNFVGTAELLRAWENHPTVRNELNAKGCKWQFIPSRAPWFGGFYERLIGMTKRVLSKALGTYRVTDQELTTLLCRTEAQLNDRPLTYTTDQLDDALPLTPSMLLQGYRYDSLPVPVVDPEETDDPSVMDRDVITKRQRHNELVCQKMWKRWEKEYLLMLRNAAQVGPPNRVPTAGDVVIIHDDGPRLRWQLGRITKLIPGIDGQVRSAQVKTCHGKLTRPILKLYPLEIEHDKVLHEDTIEQMIDRTTPNAVSPVAHVPTGSGVLSASSRPKRAAAVRARELILDQSNVLCAGECVPNI